MVIKRQKPRMKKPPNMTITELLDKKRLLIGELNDINAELQKAVSAVKEISNYTTSSNSPDVSRGLLETLKPVDSEQSSPVIDYSFRVMDPLEEGDQLEELRASIEQLNTY